MKKLVTILMMAVLLGGCSKKTVMETVSDVLDVPTAAPMQQILVQLPPELSVPAMENTESGSLYLCDTYSVTVQTVEGGDLRKTIRNATGMETEDLQIMETLQEGNKCYQWVWSTNGESGVQIGRGCILDDGAYHYVLTALAEETAAGVVQPVWKELFASFQIVSGSENVSTGS